MKVFDKNKAGKWGKSGVYVKVVAIVLLVIGFRLVGCKQSVGGGAPEPIVVEKQVIVEIPQEAKEMLEELEIEEPVEPLETLSVDGLDPIACAIIATESEWGRFPSIVYLLYPNGVAEYEDNDNPELMYWSAGYDLVKEHIYIVLGDVKYYCYDKDEMGYYIDQ